EYSRFIREDLTVTFSIEGFGVQAGTTVSSAGVAAGSIAGLAMPIGIRWNPLPGNHSHQAVKPFLLAGAGPVIGMAEGSFVRANSVSTGTISRGTMGARFGGGLDLHAARSFTIGLTIAYNVMG